MVPVKIDCKREKRYGISRTRKTDQIKKKQTKTIDTELIVTLLR